MSLFVTPFYSFCQFAPEFTRYSWAKPPFSNSDLLLVFQSTKITVLLSYGVWRGILFKMEWLPGKFFISLPYYKAIECRSSFTQIIFHKNQV